VLAEIQVILTKKAELNSKAIRRIQDLKDFKKKSMKYIAEK
jgi:hypothetical protein